MKAYLITLMTIIAISVFCMIYGHLTYVAPAGITEQQLPGIADGTFVGFMAMLLVVLFGILLAALHHLMTKKD